MKTLKEQVNGILHAKIKAIAAREYAKANPEPRKKHKPYSLPACVDTMVDMLGRIETADDHELEGMAAYATTGEAGYLATK
jgi:hypothetical protein